MGYMVIPGGKKPIYGWTEGVYVDENAKTQLRNITSMPFIYDHVAIMPDVHVGIGATIGSVIPTQGAIIPASVGVDIGCGMAAVKLEGITANELPDNLKQIRRAIEKTVPVGFDKHKGKHRGLPKNHEHQAITFIKEKHPKVMGKRKDSLDHIILSQFGTLGGGNHFIEICLDQNDEAWIMLHSGSRGIGNMIGTYFIELAKEDMRVHQVNLPDKDLAYFEEGTQYFQDYMDMVGWAQKYAAMNREEMLKVIIDVLTRYLPVFGTDKVVVNCHHNYVTKECHYGDDVWVTRKGAVRAMASDWGIIPGSMGAKSFIVKGKGNIASFQSCSHGAGRVMSRGQAKRLISKADHVKMTEGVECRKDEGVLDESPMAYKDIDAVMKAQEDLVSIEYTLKQVLCVKG